MEEYASIIIRTLVLYLVILTIFRIMGKREIAELSLLDLVVFLMIAEMAAIAIEKTDQTLFKSILPMILLVAVQYLLAFLSMKSRRFRLVVDGKPSIIINKGKINEHEMRKQRYNFDDLLLQLRQDGVGDIADVEYAILETSGQLSIFKKSEQAVVSVTLILDGSIEYQNLEVVGKSEKWLRDKLAEQGYNNLSAISYCSFNRNNHKFYIDLKDEK
ncbi:DUF421 domain-containing protein [Bacillus sp. B15-48]|uniref:DUF421 domain-containing protein n=1 Tax=Bacillus sp. B15-48 TaxID=1548601 RepID=UPI00193FD231|nr:DUF421 domain-containing protein [Bacillus sp. B15-48]MBM4762408.1 DUF421 domain-containing protein [Bacillus sp. B15-48]